MRSLNLSQTGATTANQERTSRQPAEKNPDTIRSAQCANAFKYTLYLEYSHCIRLFFLYQNNHFPKILRHTVIRSLALLFFGVMLVSIGRGEITFRFQIVLAQLAVTYLIATILLRRSVPTHIIGSVSLLFLSDLIFRILPVE